MVVTPTLIAHRGASLEAPENTLEAFKLAFAQGANGIECDVRLTADEQVVCVHDADLQRVAKSPLVVAESSLESLQSVDLGNGARVPLLSEAMATVPSGQRIYIEVKTGPEILPHLIKVIEASRIEARLITVICFESAVIKAFKRLKTRMAAFLLMEGRTNWLGRSNLKMEAVVEKLIACSADGIGLKAHSGINHALVSALRRSKYTVNVWTVDDAKVAIQLASAGVTSITTNDPKGLRGAFQ